MQRQTIGYSLVTIEVGVDIYRQFNQNYSPSYLYKKKFQEIIVKLLLETNIPSIIVLGNIPPKGVQKLIKFDSKSGKAYSYYVDRLTQQQVSFPRDNSFEIVYQDKLLHSKLQTLIFPDPGTIIDILQQIRNRQCFRNVNNFPVKVSQQGKVNKATSPNQDFFRQCNSPNTMINSKIPNNSNTNVMFETSQTPKKRVITTQDSDQEKIIKIKNIFTDQDEVQIDRKNVNINIIKVNNTILFQNRKLTMKTVKIYNRSPYRGGQKITIMPTENLVRDFNFRICRSVEKQSKSPMRESSSSFRHVNFEKRKQITPLRLHTNPPLPQKLDSGNKGDVKGALLLDYFQITSQSPSFNQNHYAINTDVQNQKANVQPLKQPYKNKLKEKQQKAPIMEYICKEDIKIQKVIQETPKLDQQQNIIEPKRRFTHKRTKSEQNSSQNERERGGNINQNKVNQVQRLEEPLQFLPTPINEFLVMVDEEPLIINKTDLQVIKNKFVKIIKKIRMLHILDCYFKQKANIQKQQKRARLQMLKKKMKTILYGIWLNMYFLEKQKNQLALLNNRSQKNKKKFTCLFRRLRMGLILSKHFDLLSKLQGLFEQFQKYNHKTLLLQLTEASLHFQRKRKLIRVCKRIKMAQILQIYFETKQVSKMVSHFLIETTMARINSRAIFRRNVRKVQIGNRLLRFFLKQSIIYQLIDELITNVSKKKALYLFKENQQNIQIQSKSIEISPSQANLIKTQNSISFDQEGIQQMRERYSSVLLSNEAQTKVIRKGDLKIKVVQVNGQRVILTKRKKNIDGLSVKHSSMVVANDNQYSPIPLKEAQSQKQIIQFEQIQNSGRGDIKSSILLEQSDQLQQRVNDSFNLQQ